MPENLVPDHLGAAVAAPRDATIVKHYHAHVYYDPASSRDQAARLREGVATTFPQATLGRWHDAPVGPHPQSMYQIAFSPALLDSLLPWLMLNRNGLTILLHPGTGDAVADHTDHAAWLGAMLPLRLDALRTDQLDPPSGPAHMGTSASAGSRPAPWEGAMYEPGALMTTDALTRELGTAGLRIYDCTTYLEPAPPGSDVPYVVVAGRNSFATAHIPGADFLDLQGEFSDPATRLRFMMPEVTQLEAAFGRHGIGAGTRVVLYSIGTMMWATRFWWMLKSLGFDGAAVLDGGFDKWQAEGLPVESGAANGYPPATFVAKPRLGRFVDKQAVLATIADPGAVIVNALGAQFHMGQEPSRYGRPGRVPGSVNVPAASLIDPHGKTLISLGDAAAKFAAAGVARDKRVIAYCGGGISATIDLFVLHQLGFADLALYDGSMGEWARDAAMPIETG